MRDVGFYWVSYDGCEQVAYWSAISDSWYLAGNEGHLNDESFDFIDEHRITRPE